MMYPMFYFDPSYVLILIGLKTLLTGLGIL